MTDPNPTITRRPTWEWTNDLRNPSTILVSPSFKPELGLVFIGIGEESRNIFTEGWTGEHQGIWLSEEQVDQLVAAVQANAQWAREHGEDCADDCACQDG